ncbi:D-alanyl-D-alanine carboxypeptidase [Arsenicibacter rosenii]|uniref:D-alanyl-D-alanine carboxypeptidase n=2 Tax=Arsenicibacter rosenii TaxID=1750698 RepID=A0A1S2VR52_9BACT|nr:D-alanyl-D-alanine carboxypeptidase [Arsenicibacter rosenii]
MLGCHLQFGQSVAKLYMATTVMKLVDEGKLVLDSPVSRYLPENIAKKLTNPEKVTVRMLLNHTSGVPDYTENTAYVASVLQNPLKQYTTDDLLNYMTGVSSTATPGAFVRYSNSNYLLLALMTDYVGGNHVRLLQDRILTPLDARQTFYHNSATYLEQPTLVDSYFDRFGDGKLENITQMQRANVASMYGDDGIIASPTDYLKFLRGLLEGKLVSTGSLKEMTTWYNDKEGKPAYGLGLEKTTVAGQEAYGHGGAGIGAGCALYYLPEKKTYLFIGINLGVLTDGPYVRLADELTKELVTLL